MDYLTQAEAILADKAYDADQRIRKKLSEKGCEAVIPSEKNRLNPFDTEELLQYDKTSQNFLGAIFLAVAIIWLN